MDIIPSLAQIPWDGRAVLLVDLDAFFASVEQLDHPGWRGKPVIVGGDPKKHGVVSTASYEARKYGVRSAMPSSMAAQLCPDAIWTQGHFDRYKEMSREVMSILARESPKVQQVSVDEAFMDVTPTFYNTEHPVDIARRIQASVTDLGLTCSIGVGTSKTVAKIASEIDKPFGLTVVYPGQEAAFLSSLPVGSMSGIGRRSQESLKRHGIRTLGDLASASDSILRSVFGKNSEKMRERCLGKDADAVAPDDSVKSISNEVTLSEDIRSASDAHSVIGTLCANVGRRLRKKGLAGTRVTLKLKYADRSTKSSQRTLPHPVDNEIEFSPVAVALFDEAWLPGMPIRLIGVAITGFDGQEESQQSLMTELFPEELGALEASARADDLVRASDMIKDRFGESSLFYGRDLTLKGRTTGTGMKNPTDYK